MPAAAVPRPLADHLKALLKAPVTGAAGMLAPWLLDRDRSLQRREKPLVTLMYHRILPHDDPRRALEEPGMIVTPASFERQLRILKQLFTILPLAEWIERRRRNQPLPPRACAVTFDDGWLDNFEFALPILEREQVPATIFVVSDMIGTHREFWPNRLAALFADTTRDRNSAEFRWLHGRPGFRLEGVPGREAIAALIGSCKALSDAELTERLDAMESGGTARPAAPALMDWQQLRALQQTGLIDIGSHTRNHRRLLEGLDAATLHSEIVDSRTHIERELERPVSLFCYPNGDASAAAKELVDRHYLAAVTTRSGINSAATPAHELFRIAIHEDIADTTLKFRARLSGWR
jgi:peptidoglycan/xylan/chitin deacetylase (PgdA/CDA1 family)